MEPSPPHTAPHYACSRNLPLGRWDTGRIIQWVVMAWREFKRVVYQFQCPYLGAMVELSEERIAHIQHRHGHTWPDLEPEVRQTLAEPTEVRQSDRDPQTRLFSRFFETLRTGRYLVVVTVSEVEPSRHWIVTMYTSRRLTGGIREWSKA